MYKIVSKPVLRKVVDYILMAKLVNNPRGLKLFAENIFESLFGREMLSICILFAMPSQV